MKQSSIIRNRKEVIIRNLAFGYDKLNDLLYIYKKDSYVYSNVMIGEFHLEFDKEMRLVGVEILNASEMLSEYGIPQKNLENIQEVELKAVVRNSSLLVFLMIRALDQKATAAITLNSLESPFMKIAASA